LGLSRRGEKSLMKNRVRVQQSGRGEALCEHLWRPGRDDVVDVGHVEEVQLLKHLDMTQAAEGDGSASCR
jgi:hypothetical protein